MEEPRSNRDVGRRGLPRPNHFHYVGRRETRSRWYFSRRAAAVCSCWYFSRWTDGDGEGACRASARRQAR